MQKMYIPRAIRRKMLWLFWTTLVLALVASAGVAHAQKSASYNVQLSSLAGGNYGGGTLSSTSYSLLISSGNLIRVSSTSTGYELCSGFVCQADHSYFQIRLPAVSNTN
jgi:uncharacterized membrane protein